MSDLPTLEAFRGWIGERFAVGDRVVLVLVEAEARGEDAFGLRFRGPAEPLLEQATYRLEREDGDALEIFIVPIGRDEAGVVYEAIFA